MPEFITTANDALVNLKGIKTWFPSLTLMPSDVSFELFEQSDRNEN